MYNCVAFFAGTWVDQGTSPAGSTWAMNPIPRIDFDSTSSGTDCQCSRTAMSESVPIPFNVFAMAAGQPKGYTGCAMVNGMPTGCVACGNTGRKVHHLPVHRPRANISVQASLPAIRPPMPMGPRMVCPTTCSGPFDIVHVNVVLARLTSARDLPVRTRVLTWSLGNRNPLTWKAIARATGPGVLLKTR